MSNETILTIVGNLTADPELKFTPSGAAAASFTVASTPRTFDKAANDWKEGDTLFMRCSIWREAAENVAESLTKGTRVIVQGRLVQRSYETREGEKRTVVELQVDEVGPSLRYATAKVARKGHVGGQSFTGNGFAQDWKPIEECQCGAGITHRDEHHRQSVCVRASGHSGAHDDGQGCVWTGGNQ